MFQIEYYFCADWKMMAETCGLYGPTSDHPCIWCEGKKDMSYQPQRSGNSDIEC